jgi:hypothetical protein
MAISRVKVWSAGEVLLAADLNGEFNNILNNPVDLWSPAGKAFGMAGFAINLDAAGTSSISASVNARIDLALAGTTLNRFNTVASAVNGIDWTASATGVSVKGAPFGTDANIDFRLAPKGTGIFNAVNGDITICNGRLTLTTLTAVTTADVTAATTLYFTPYIGDKIYLFDGTDKWECVKFSEISIAVPATTVTMYDVFVFSTAGVATLEVLAWTNDTTRATALVLQNGIYVKSGATTRRYVGSFRTTGVSGQTEDSIAKRYVWNYYNRVLRLMKAVDAAASWTYSTQTWRQANANAANQLDFIVGISESIVTAEAISSASNSTSTTEFEAGIGLDVTNANSSSLNAFVQVAATVIVMMKATYQGLPGIGRHFLAWLEISQANATTTWNGTSSRGVSGIVGQITA